MLEPGEIVDDRFIVEAMVGEGGLAQVFRVRHRDLGSVHALKLLTWKKKKLAERLILEGRIQAQLRHPNIVAVTDLVRHDGQLGLLMEYIDHQTLEDCLRHGGPMPLEEAMPLFAAVVSAVSAAHELGVSHRDLKPANIMLAMVPGGGVVPKVADFGIAKVVADVADGGTAVGAAMGTPGYLAPEQLKDASGADLRADIFALGAIFYEMVSGRMAFADAEGQVAMAATIDVEPVPLRQHLPDCPEYIELSLMRAMEKDPSRRYPDCASFAEDIFGDHPRLLALIAGMASTTTTLQLKGIRSTLDRQRASMSKEASLETFAPLEAIAEPPPAGRSAGPMLAVAALVGGVLMLGAVGLGVVLAGGAGMVGVARMSETEQPAPQPAEPLPAEQPRAAQADPVAIEPESPEPDEPDAEEPEPPEPEPAEPEPQAVDPQPRVKDPKPRTPDPEPSSTEPEPEPEPAEAPEPVGDGVAEAEPPAPEAPAFPAVAGKWVVTANGRPMELSLNQSGGSLTGSIVLQVVPSVRKESIAGTVGADGALSFAGGGYVFTGSATASRLSGTYMGAGSKKSFAWSAVK